MALLHTREVLEREKAILVGMASVLHEISAQGRSTLLLLFHWDGLDALVDLSAAQRAQDDLRCSLAEDAMQFDRGQRGVTIGQQKAEDRSSQGGLFSDVVRQLAAMGAQALPEAVNFRHFGCLWIDPVNLFCLQVVGVDCLTFGAQVASQVDAKIATLLTPPLKVNVEFGVDVGFDPFAHWIRPVQVGGKRHCCAPGS